MRRKLVVLGLPVLVLALWGASSLRGSQTDAEVDITAARPTQLRGAVVAAVTAAGGERVSENTSYDGAGSSTLTFNVPTARIEQAIEALGGLGGRITDQRIDLSNAADQAAGVSQKLTDAQSCVDNLPAGGAAQTELAQCRTELAGVADRLDNAKVDLSTSVLEVKVTAPTSDHLVLILAILLVLATTVGIGLMIRRIDSLRPAVEIREVAEFETVEEEIHLRRN